MESLFTSLSDALEALSAGMMAAGGALLVVFVYGIAALLALGITYLIRIHIAYRMAKNRDRDPLGWVLLSFFFSPVLTWIFLLIAGKRR